MKRLTTFLKILSSYVFPFYFLHFALITIYLFTFSGYCQEYDSEQIIKAYKTYSEAPREVIYIHLNKSEYVPGEMIGFQAYVFDKFSKRLSSLTTNLYCTITDSTNTVLKEKLIHVKDGFAANVFKIDSAFIKGNYTFKSFTNWQRNFHEQNHFQQDIKILGVEANKDLLYNYSDPKSLDLQILGEGGHLVYDVMNNAGIIAKDKYGNGIKNASGFIKDDSGQIVSSFKLNEFGIGKTVFIPNQNTNYYIHLDNLTHNPIKIEGIKTIGFTIAINKIKNGVLALMSSNRKTIELIKGESYKLIVHNGKNASVFNFSFEDITRQINIPADLLFSGVNIFTVLDKNNKPILERQYFNYEGIELGQLDLISLSRKSDSIYAFLEFMGKVEDKSKSNILSISVLPANSYAYNHPNTILSQVYLQPYVKSRIEQPSYYFNKVDRKIVYDMDVLMLTLGWSSYDWKTIFDFEGTYNYNFENGLDVLANINDKKDNSTYITYPLKNNITQLFTITKTDKSFLIKNLFPIDNEKLRIGIIGSKNERPNVYPQISLTQVPKFTKSYTFSNRVSPKIISNTELPNIPEAWNKAEQLKEIVITGKSARRFENENKIKITGKLVEISNQEKQRSTPLAAYLNRLGFVAQYDYVNATFTITNPRVNWGNNVPLVYLDGALLTSGSLEILSNLTLDFIDYLDIELYGIGGGIRGQAGYIKIYTDRDYYIQKNNSNQKTMEVTFPLTFSDDKKYYTPQYQSYTSEFFSDYGVISWLTNLKVNENGIVGLSFHDTITENVNLHVEGIIDDTLISQTITLTIK